jgi:PAS domain S-box-containing protein
VEDFLMTDKPTYEELEERVKDLEREAVERKRAEEALRKSERRYRRLLDFVPFPVALFNLDRTVSYLNPMFTKVFGWTLIELQGKRMPFVPPDLMREASKTTKRVLKEKVLLGQETKRLTKDGRVLDVAIRASLYSESGTEPAGVLLILRDITQEKRSAQISDALLRISTALPEYPNLEELLHYIDNEVKRLLGTEGSVVILRDEEKEELYVLGAAYDVTATEKRVKEIRFSMDQLVAGKVIKTGNSIIVSDTSKDRGLHQERDKKLGYRTRNLLLVPLKTSDRIIGALCAINKKEGAFGHADVDLLGMIAGTVAISIENARVSAELKKAYNEVTSLNRAKDKVINHLSHELKTPVSILSGALNRLVRILEALPEETWKSTIEMVRRNLNRIVDIQYEVADIMEDRQYKTYGLLTLLLDLCADELEVLFAEEVEDGRTVERVRKRIEELFGPQKVVPQEVVLDEYVRKRLEELTPLFSHRQVEITTHLNPAPPIYIPLDPLQKVIDGLVRNSIENTPDEGKVEITVQKKGEGVELVVRDYGVGITEENQKRIFEGFFTTQDTMAYSSKRPFDFNAGGKGADLLRMKIFSERYGFKIDMTSSRCRFIPEARDMCPGRISKCSFCEGKEDCHGSGSTVFSLYFPPAQKKVSLQKDE